MSNKVAGIIQKCQGHVWQGRAEEIFETEGDLRDIQLMECIILDMLLSLMT